MKILILEDNKERIEWFKRIYKNHELFIFTDLVSAKNFIMFQEIDVLFLDYDLEEKNLEATKLELTGYDFAKFIVENYLCKNSMFYIHSCNPCGGTSIESLLKTNGYKADWIPYYLLIQSERE